MAVLTEHLALDKIANPFWKKTLDIFHSNYYVAKHLTIYDTFRQGLEIYNGLTENK